jgi:DNA-binding Xre family transcriptional regulator
VGQGGQPSGREAANGGVRRPREEEGPKEPKGAASIKRPIPHRIKGKPGSECEGAPPQAPVLNLPKTPNATTTSWPSVRGWSQETLAEHAGLHRTYISGIERAERNLGLDNLDKLAQAFGVTVGDLLKATE